MKPMRQKGMPPTGNGTEHPALSNPKSRSPFISLTFEDNLL